MTDARARGTTRPPWVTWLRTILEADLDPYEKLTLVVLFLHLDVADRDGGLRVDGEVWPGMETLAALAGCTPNAARCIVKRLEARGVIGVTRSRGGPRRTHRYRLELARLRRANPTLALGLAGGDNPNAGGVEPPTTGARTPSVECANPTPALGEPSMHPPREPTKGTGHALEQLPEASAIGSMDAMDLRTALHRCGIRGPNLEALASAPNLTPAGVLAELRSIVNAGGVRNPAAVLAKRLAQQGGLTLAKPRTSRLDATDLTRLAALERLRRNRGGR